MEGSDLLVAMTVILVDVSSSATLSIPLDPLACMFVFCDLAPETLHNTVGSNSPTPLTSASNGHDDPVERFT